MQSELKPGQVNLNIQVKWVTFSPGHAGRRVGMGLYSILSLKGNTILVSLVPSPK